MTTSAHVTYTLANTTGYTPELCKIALEHSKNDVSVAKRLLERWNSKKPEDSAIFGTVATLFHKNFNAGALVEAQCTSEIFSVSKEFYDIVANIIINVVQDENFHNEQLKIEKAEIKYNCKITINTARIEKSGPFSLITTYSHKNRICSIIETEVTNERAFNHKDFRLFSYHCAMHVAAFNPYTVRKNEMPKQLRNDLTNQFEKELLRENKPLNLWPAIIDGKLNKWAEQHALLDHIFIKSNKETVDSVRQKIGTQIGSDINVKRFARLAL